jgi:hypothetical protein
LMWFFLFFSQNKMSLPKTMYKVELILLTYLLLLSWE